MGVPRHDDSVRLKEGQFDVVIPDLCRTDSVGDRSLGIALGPGLAIAV